MNRFKRVAQAIGLWMLSGSLMAVEEAKFDLFERDGDFELRDYAPQVVAEVVVEGDFESAGNRAFRPLFKYISGDNTAQQKIAMTSPVGQKPSPAETGEKIAMTAPVAQRVSGGGYAVSFMMPADFTLETTPTPTNPVVTLREVPPQRMAAVRFSGRWTQARYEEQLAALRAWVRSRELRVTGEPVFARYNGPMTLWFLRRNEILLPVAGSI